MTTLSATQYKDCRIKNCYKKVRGYGMCQRHYSNCRLNGFPLPARGERHNLRHTPEYTTWVNLRARCNNKNARGYSRYGGRGIKVCKEWQESFVEFYKDMGKKPSSEHSIDRIDNNGNYEPGNCRWATKRVQALNQRIRSTNKSGHKNIRLRKDNNMWVVNVKSLGKKGYLGQFKTLNEAVDALTESGIYPLNA